MPTPDDRQPRRPGLPPAPPVGGLPAAPPLRRPGPRPNPHDTGPHDTGQHDQAPPRPQPPGTPTSRATTPTATPPTSAAPTTLPTRPAPGAPLPTRPGTAPPPTAPTRPAHTPAPAPAPAPAGTPPEQHPTPAPDEPTGTDPWDTAPPITPTGPAAHPTVDHVPNPQADPDPRPGERHDDPAAPKRPATSRGARTGKTTKAVTIPRSKSRTGKRGRPPGVTLTDRDRVLIEFLARYKYATYQQAADYLGMSNDALRQRVRKLERIQVIAIHRGATAINLLTATAAGMAAVGLELPISAPQWNSMRHTLGLVDLGVFFEQAGEVVVTEREIHAAWAKGQLTRRMMQAAEWTTAPIQFGESNPQMGMFVVPPDPSSNGTSGFRIPDLVLVRPPAESGQPMSVAVELELSLKDNWRMRNIIGSYSSRGRTRFGGVIYYTPYSDIASLVTRVAADRNARDFVAVRQFTPSIGLTYE